MDIRSEFKDLNIGDNDVPEALPISNDSKNEADIVKNLENRLASLTSSEKVAPTVPKEEVLENEEGESEVEVGEEYEDLEEQTFLDKIQPFVLPIALTIFAIIFAGMFLYFFSKSRVENTAQAIVNAGVPEQVYYPPAPIPVIIKEEPLTCELPQILNESADACITPEPEPEVIKKPSFENGITSEVNVRFSYDKFNYDNSPRGIYLTGEQLFDGEYEDFKINPNNRAFANDYFFGVDRYTVSLIGNCSYLITDAKILVKDMKIDEDKKIFTGEVAKVIEASKPKVDCSK